MPILAPKNRGYTSQARLPATTGGQFAGVGPSTATGRAISRLGQVITLRAEERKKEHDAAVVGEMYNAWRDQDREILSDLLQRRGRDAVDLDLEYNRWFDQKFSDADLQTENRTQQDAITNALNRKRGQNLDVLARYESMEARRYRDEQETGIVANAVTDARQHSFDDIALENTMVDVFDWVEAAHPGMSDEAQRALQTRYRSEMLFANMQARIDENPTQALKDIDQWKDQLGSGHPTLKASANDRLRAGKIEARIAKNAAKTDDKEAKLEARDAAILGVANALYLDKDPVRAAMLLGRSAHIKGGDIATWYKNIESFSKGEKPPDPFKESDPEYANKIFESASAGFIDPETLRPLPDKLSREDYRLAKSIAEYATKPDTKYIRDLTKSVLKEGADIIVGTDWMFIDKPDKAIQDKGTMERFIYSELVNAESDAEKIELLDGNSKNFVLRKAFQSIGRNYDKEKEQQPGFSSLFFEPGGQQQGPVTDIRQLWGEDVPKAPKKPLSPELEELREDD